MMEYKEILIKIRRIVRSINLESKRVQKDFGVSIPQILCLEYLRQSPGYQATQKSIRDHLNLNSSTVTGIVGRLEKKGYLARLPRSGDKRVMHISLTSSGDALLERTPDLLQQRLKDKLKHLSDNDIEHIGVSLDLLIQMLEIEHSDDMPLILGEVDPEGV